MTKVREGGCACGAVRYRMMSEPMFVHCCHCTSCQQSSGSAFALNAMIESDRVEHLNGDLEPINTPTDSGRGQDIVRCASCKVAVWSYYAVKDIGDAMSFVRVGTLDNAAEIQPSIHIYTSSKQPWVQLPQDTPSVERYYDLDDQWSADNIARRTALIKTS